MKNIIITMVLSSLLPAIAVAEDRAMHNDSPNAPLMSGKHMMSSDPNASVMKGKHMMSDNPYSEHSKDKDAAGKANRQGNPGYRVIPYKK